MTRGLVFWVLMLIWFVFALMLNIAPAALGSWEPAAAGGNAVLFFVLFGLLGWQGYGPPIHG